MTPSHRSAPAFLLLLSAAACGGGAESVATQPGAPRLDLTVGASASDVTLMVRTPSAAPGERGGTTRQLDAAVKTKSGRTLPAPAESRTVVWTSLDPAIVTVDTTGLLAAQGVGETRVVVAHREGVWSDTVRVTVVPVPVRTVAVTGPATLAVDDSATFAAAALDSAGAPLLGRAVAWSTPTPTLVAPTTTPGEFAALAVGNATVDAAVDGVHGTATVAVVPQPVATVTVVPATASLPQFRRTTFAAEARDKRGKLLGGRAIAWTSSAPAVLEVSAAGQAVARDVGGATVTATAEGKSGSAAATVTNPVEARALWVTRFEYTGASAVDFAKIAQIFQKAASANFNVVYFQVRTSGDALYYSDLEPCSPRMCGRLGGPRPAQDPLAVALAEGAKHGIEVHAWLNAYTGFISGGATACNQFVESTPPNWLKAHPEWSVSTKNFATGVLTRQVDNCATTSEYMWVSPGVPEVRAQLAAVSADIARRYGPLGLKGIHLDRIRYPSNQVSYDAPSQEAFRLATGSYPASNAQASWLDFRRGFVNQGVKEVHDAVRAVDPSLVISAAVFPGYKARAGWSAQWSFTDLFQDPQAWAQGGYLDVEVPMNYPATAASTSWTVKAYCSNTDWTCVMDDHVARIEGQAGRHVYVGVGAIKGWDEVQRQLDLAHDRAITGVSVYSFSQVDAIPNGWAQLAAGPFKHKATIPPMSWK
ncbi:family 10 glycosylhydrolase [Roseisolibacter sp. H3M3-2]|uniref:family 10 glycosylhydrolase n=1 Tax=Roseisolibacter sp. H3M3-2 TaxID=3031323 RepID=UPI0023DCBA8D|nr:family 10 glycosylhydrolase [Roseisolibacter sp. H3M3-2]MDF1503768.1 family 10 glycosylhydrolase [Roseisolibacter sp. H3M3-2]